MLAPKGMKQPHFREGGLTPEKLYKPFRLLRRKKLR
jgi:hypothetical protein